MADWANLEMILVLTTQQNKSTISSKLYHSKETQIIIVNKTESVCKKVIIIFLQQDF